MDELFILFKLLSAVKVFICSFSNIITRIVNGITCNDTTHYWVASHVERDGVPKYQQSNDFRNDAKLHQSFQLVIMT